MAKTLVSLTLGESKTSVNLSLETKEAGITWDQALETWDENTSTWDAVKAILSKESKSKVNLTLE